MTVSAGDCHPWPIYNARFRVTFPILDADGDLVTAASSPDSEASQDQGTFADCTNEATEIATSSGVYYLDLIATEMDTQNTTVIVKTATSGAKTTTLTLYPRRLPVIRTGTAQAGGASTITLDSSASAIDNFYVGCYVNITNNSPANALGQARMITGYVGSTKVATVQSAWGTNPSSASTFEILLPGYTTSTTAWAGTQVTDPIAVGQPAVDVKYISNDSTAADNAELMFDGTGYAGGTTKLTTNVTQWNTSNVATPDTAGYPKVTIKSGTGTGEINLASGVANSNLINIAGAAVDTTAAQIGVNIVNYKGNAVPTADTAGYPKVTVKSGTGTGEINLSAGVLNTVTNLTNAPTAGDLTATMKASINTEADTALSDYGALKPTTAGRTLDVTATGEAGIDWSNIGAPTTAQNLSGTTIATTQKVDLETVKTQSVTCAAGVTVNTNVGTTQPVNFTGTGGSALVKGDTVDIAGAAVSTSSAQIGTNVVNIAGDSTAATRLKNLFTAAVQGTVDDATFTPTTTAFETSFTVDTDKYTSEAIYFVTGDNAGFTSGVTAYAFTNSKVKLTVNALPAAPADGDVFLVFGKIS